MKWCNAEIVKALPTICPLQLQYNSRLGYLGAFTMARISHSTPRVKTTRNSKPRPDTDAALNAVIELWVEKEKSEVPKRLNIYSLEYTEAINDIYDQYLSINGLYWTQMLETPRYRLPKHIQTHIIRFMQRYHIIAKGKKHQLDKFRQLYKELQIGETASRHLHTKFVRLCQNKVDSFIQAKCRKFKKQGIYKVIGTQIEWARFTAEWEREDWNGECRPVCEFQSTENAIQAFRTLSAHEKANVIIALQSDSSNQPLCDCLLRDSFQSRTFANTSGHVALDFTNGSPKQFSSSSIDFTSDSLLSFGYDGFDIDENSAQDGSSYTS